MVQYIHCFSWKEKKESFTTLCPRSRSPSSVVGRSSPLSATRAPAKPSLSRLRRPVRRTRPSPKRTLATSAEKCSTLITTWPATCPFTPVSYSCNYSCNLSFRPLWLRFCSWQSFIPVLVYCPCLWSITFQMFLFFYVILLNSREHFKSTPG
jgi:hypothetical protein